MSQDRPLREAKARRFGADTAGCSPGTGSGLGFQLATMNLASRNVSIAVMVNASPEGEGLSRDFNLTQPLFEPLAKGVEGG